MLMVTTRVALRAPEGTPRPVGRALKTTVGPEPSPLATLGNRGPFVPPPPSLPTDSVFSLFCPPAKEQPVGPS